MESVIEQLQKQNENQFRRIERVEKVCARIFGNGDDTGTISGRLRTMEGDMGEIKQYIAEQRVTADVLKAMEKRANRRLLAVVAVMGVVMAGASAAVSLLA